MKWKILMVCVVLLLIGISFAWSNSVYDVDTIGERNTFLQGCNRIVRQGDVSHIVYAQNYGIYTISFNHSSGQWFNKHFVIGQLSGDHLHPCLIMSNDGYFHLVYGSRPDPGFYLRSVHPYNINTLVYDEKNPPIMLDESLTYPLMAELNGKIYIMMRKGNAVSGKIMLYVIQNNELIDKIQITNYSQEFVPYPIDVVKRPFLFGQLCFMFNFRDTNLTDKYNINPSIRDFMSILCTDGTDFFDINGNPVSLPLDQENYFTLPRVITGTPYVQDSGFYNETANYYFNITDDGAYAEFTIIPKEFGNSAFVFRDNESNVVSATIFNSTGQIITTDNTTLVYVSDYDVNRIHTLRFKYYFSIQTYRLWIDGKPAGVYDIYGYPEKNRTSINELDIYPYSNPYISFEVGKDYKLSTASICLDKNNKINIFFNSRDDNANKVHWNLAHLRNGNIRYISNPDYSVFHPTCTSDDNNLYVAIEYFIPNNDSSYQSYYGAFDSTGEIYILNSSDYVNWDEHSITYNTSYGNIYPNFMKPFSSPFSKPLKEIVWKERNITDDSQSRLKYTTFDVIINDPDPEPNIGYSKLKRIIKVK